MGVVFWSGGDTCSEEGAYFSRGGGICFTKRGIPLLMRGIPLLMRGTCWEGCVHFTWGGDSSLKRGLFLKWKGMVFTRGTHLWKKRCVASIWASDGVVVKMRYTFQVEGKGALLKWWCPLTLLNIPQLEMCVPASLQILHQYRVPKDSWTSTGTVGLSWVSGSQFSTVILQIHWCLWLNMDIWPSTKSFFWIVMFSWQQWSHYCKTHGVSVEEMRWLSLNTIPIQFLLGPQGFLDLDWYCGPAMSQLESV